jgi:hypothetical protein
METAAAETSTVEASAAKPTNTACTQARKSVIAFEAGGLATVIAAKDAVITGIASLFKSRRPQALQRAGSRRPTKGGAVSRLCGEAARHIAIRIRHADSMCPVMCPS